MTRSKIWDWIMDRLRERKWKRQAGIDDSRGTDEDESTSENQDTGSGSRRIHPRPKTRRHTDDPIRGTKFANGLTRTGEFGDKFIKPE